VRTACVLRLSMCAVIDGVAKVSPCRSCQFVVEFLLELKLMRVFLLGGVF